VSDLTRRSFLKAAAATAGAAVLSPTSLRAAVQDSGLKLGAQSYTFRNFDLEQALKRMKDLGLKYAEFYQKHVPAESSPDKLAAILKLCKEYDVTPAAYGVQRFTKNHDANKKLFDFGKSLGIKAFSADPDPDSFDSLDKLCEEYQIAIGIHPHGPAGKGVHRWPTAEKILEAVKSHHKLIGSCLDTGHLIRMAQVGQMIDPAQQVRLMGDRNFGMHLKDHDNKRKTDVPFGDPTGVLNIPEVLKALKEVGFKYAVSIEYEANPAEPTADMMKNVAAVREAAKKVG
jgi:sugar phosphate isomerase/epimerase